jgi:hypothetical protein
MATSVNCDIYESIHEEYLRKLSTLGDEENNPQGGSEYITVRILV